MTNPKPMTALEVLAERSNHANNLYHKRRAEAATSAEANHIDMKSHRSGEAVAYNDAYHIMKAELHRLCNRFQNGQLTVDDFGVVL